VIDVALPQSQTTAQLRDFFEDGPPIELSDVEARRWAGYFIRNKMPLIALASRFVSPIWEQALAEAWADYEAQREEYRQVVEDWEAAGIHCVAIKSGGFFPSLPYTSDNLDLMVPAERRDDACAILDDHAYVWLQNIDEPHKLLYRKFRGGRSVSAFHVHTWVGWEVEFMEDALADRAGVSADDPLVRVPSPEDALLINAAHAFFENKRFGLYDLERIRRQWSRPDFDWDYVQGVARRRGWQNGLHFALAVCAELEEASFGRCSAPEAQRRDWLQAIEGNSLLAAYYRRVMTQPRVLPFHVPFLFSKLLYYQKVLSDRHDLPSRRLINVAQTLVWGIRLKAQINPQAGMLVTFSGIDGAGKTSHVELLSRAFAISALSSLPVWSRRGCGPLYRAAASAARRRSLSEGVTASVEAPRSPVGAFVWSLASVLDLLAVYTLRVRIPLLRGTIVIADRYVADAAVEMRQALGPRSRLAEPLVGLLRRLAPRPDLAYLVDADPDEAAVRAVDVESPEVLRQARALFAAEVRGGHVEVLAADAPFIDVNDAVVRKTLRTYFRRYPTFWNAMTLSNPMQLNDVSALLARQERQQP
jgi:thymidylate kinase